MILLVLSNRKEDVWTLCTVISPLLYKRSPDMAKDGPTTTTDRNLENVKKRVVFPPQKTEKMSSQAEAAASANTAVQYA